MRNFHMYFSGTGHAVMKPFLLLFYIKSGARLDNTSYGKGEKKTSCHWNSVSVGAESLTVLWLLLCWVLRWLLNILSAKTKTKKCAENKSCMICFESHIVWYKSRFPFPFFFLPPAFSIFISLKFLPLKAATLRVFFSAAAAVVQCMLSGLTVNRSKHKDTAALGLSLWK